MKTELFTVNPLEENTYVVSDESGEAVIIDCGCFAESEWRQIRDYIEQNGLHVSHLLNTHLHFDHTLGNRFALRDYGLRTEASAADAYLYEGMWKQMALMMGERLANHFDVAFSKEMGPALQDGDRVTFGQTVLEVIATPGHTPGGLCFYNREAGVLFSGDSLFMGSIGRTDLEGGNYASLVSSLSERIMTLPPTTVVYTGHGPATTIEHELNFNPYLT